MTNFRGLDDECPTCGRTVGDHTLREFETCTEARSVDMPYTALDDSTAAVATRALRERFELDEDLLIADHVVLRAAYMGGDAGPLGMRIPALLHEFQIGIPGEGVTTVAQVMLIADAATMRAYGRLARDTANGAANRAEAA